MQKEDALRMIGMELATQELQNSNEHYSKLLLDLVSLCSSFIATSSVPRTPKYTYFVSAMVALIVSRICHHCFLAKDFKDAKTKIKVLKDLKRQLENGINIFKETEIQDFSEELTKYLKKYKKMI